MLHVAIAERQGLTALLGEHTVTITAEGRWYVEDWLSLIVETMGSVSSDTMVYHEVTRIREQWVFCLAGCSHDTTEQMCRH
jgi:hypothetical protein